MGTDPAGRVMVFAPVPQLTVTIEQQTAGAELHVHPGGQGIWQARMCAALACRSRCAQRWEARSVM